MAIQIHRQYLEIETEATMHGIDQAQSFFGERGIVKRSRGRQFNSRGQTL